MTWVDIEDGDSMADVRAKLNVLGQETTPEVEGSGQAGYQHAGGTTAIPANTWTQIPNDGLGPRSNEDFLPEEVDTLLDSATGQLDARQLVAGDAILVQVEFELDIDNNNTFVEIRFITEEEAGPYEHVHAVGELSKGTATPYRIAESHLFLANGNSIGSLVPVEIRCTNTATLSAELFLVQVTRVKRS
jgi:hypothetical protein